METKLAKPLAVVLIALASVLAMYSASYLALVEREYNSVEDIEAGRCVAAYRLGDRWLSDGTALFFSPMHWLDRKIRPEFWERPSRQAPPSPVPATRGE